MHYIRTGKGKPLLLIHGLGSSARSWRPITYTLGRQREVLALDLPGFGTTPPLAGPATFRRLTDAVVDFLRTEGLAGIDAVGSSMGGRMVLELARRGGSVGAVVALDPGGFWSSWQKHFLYCSLYASIRLVRLLQPALPAISRSAVARTLLLAQISARPWRLPPSLVLDELCNYAESPAFDDMLHDLTYGEQQLGAPAGSISAPLVIGWGRRDRLCFRGQAPRALKAFPDARLHWFQHSGHYPQWDEPSRTAELILHVTSSQERDAMQQPTNRTSKWPDVPGRPLAPGSATT
jgi:pimeloyl-ACP methyl ester carboxylesterase